MADPFETEAKAWMEKAWRDLEMAQRAVAVMPPFYDMAVYHCQQSGEKAVKAFLVLRGLVFEKTHDIELLISLAREIEPGFSKLSDAADALTPYATRVPLSERDFLVGATTSRILGSLGPCHEYLRFCADAPPRSGTPVKPADWSTVLKLRG